MKIRCERCNGRGGWEGWPGFTCYACGGLGHKLPTEQQPARVRRMKCCGGLTAHWNGLYARQCPICDVNHGRESCPKCGAAHPDLTTRQIPNCYAEMK